MLPASFVFWRDWIEGADLGLVVLGLEKNFSCQPGWFERFLYSELIEQILQVFLLVNLILIIFLWRNETF